MNRRESVWVILIVLLVALTFGPAYVGASPLMQQNLLTNPGFEPPYNNGVANGWSPWHEDSGDVCGENQSPWNFVCRPNWWQEADYNGYGLTRGGSSQAVGVQYHTWHAGVFQTVSVPPGTVVRFSVWGNSFGSEVDLPDCTAAGGNQTPHIQVGIDPEGRGLWNAPGIAWSGEVNPVCSWQQVSVEATAGANGRVTVFTSARFRDVRPLKHMDVWWDEASLVVATPAATAVPTAAPRPTNTPGPPPPPPATSTPRPDGAIVHVVRSGDTLSAIAAQYGVTVEQIQQLNYASIGAGNIIQVGQELVISIPAATPTTPPQPTVDPATLPSPTPIESGAATGSGICVLVYNDRNNDTFRQSDTEEMLPNAMIALGDANGIIGQYTTDGLSEPYCFTNIQAGTYRLTLQPPPGYVASGPSDMSLGLGADGRMDVAFGAKRSELDVTPTTEAEEPAAGDDGGFGSDLLRWAARLSGILMLVLAIVIGVIFVLSRRK